MKTKYRILTPSNPVGPAKFPTLSMVYGDPFQERPDLLTPNDVVCFITSKNDLCIYLGDAFWVGAAGHVFRDISFTAIAFDFLEKGWCRVLK